MIGNDETLHQLVSTEAEDLSREELTKLEEARNERGEADVILDTPGKFTVIQLTETCACFSSGFASDRRNGNHYERSAKFERQIQDAFACNKFIKMKQIVQPKLNIFLKTTALSNFSELCS